MSVYLFRNVVTELWIIFTHTFHRQWSNSGPSGIQFVAAPNWLNHPLSFPLLDPGMACHSLVVGSCPLDMLCMGFLRQWLDVAVCSLCQLVFGCTFSLSWSDCWCRGNLASIACCVQSGRASGFFYLIVSFGWFESAMATAAVEWGGIPVQHDHGRVMDITWGAWKGNWCKELPCPVSISMIAAQKPKNTKGSHSVLRFNRCITLASGNHSWAVKMARFVDGWKGHVSPEWVLHTILLYVGLFFCGEDWKKIRDRRISRIFFIRAWLSKQAGPTRSFPLIGHVLSKFSLCLSVWTKCLPHCLLMPW